jgi:hypothetical protein
MAWRGVPTEATCGSRAAEDRKVTDSDSSAPVIEAVSCGELNVTTRVARAQASLQESANIKAAEPRIARSDL